MTFTFKAAAAGAAVWSVVSVFAAALAEEAPTVRLEPLRGNLYVLFGQGGNIGVSAGEEGVFLIDDQYAPLNPNILAAIRNINPGPIRFVLNTHYHGDHTGGNENLGELGTVIIAHDNVRPRIERDLAADGKDPKAVHAALPLITFNDQSSLYLNGEEARAIHIEHAHTDGDSIIVFAASNVVHMGDLFFNGHYPYIDDEAGGSIDGLLAGLETALAKIDADTIIIPGHGPIGARGDLIAYRDMLKTIRERVAALKAAGKTLEEVIAAKPTDDFDAVWSWSYIKAADIIRPIFNTVGE